MNRTNLFFYIIYFSLIVTPFFTSCSKKAVAANSAAVFSTIYPTSAKGGDTITLYGSNFLMNASNEQVTINSKAAVITWASADSIKAVVPKLSGTGLVILTVKGQSLPGVIFTYNYQVTVSTIAGSGAVGKTDGTALSASFYCPWGISADTNGDLYIADSYNRLIRKYSAANNYISSINIPLNIGASTFFSPYNISLSIKTHSLYVTDFNTHLMKIDAARNFSIIYDGDAVTTGIAVTPDGNLLMSNNTKGNILKLDTSGNLLSIFASDLITPRNIVPDKAGYIYVPGTQIYKFDSTGKTYPSIFDYQFKGWEIAVDTSGNIFEADHFDNCIRMVDKFGNASTIAGNGEAADVDGTGLNSSFNGPMGICMASDGCLYVSTFNFTDNTGNKIRKITLQ